MPQGTLNIDHCQYIKNIRYKEYPVSGMSMPERSSLGLVNIG